MGMDNGESVSRWGNTLEPEHDFMGKSHGSTELPYLVYRWAGNERLKGETGEI
jgi:hypothetical protein